MNALGRTFALLALLALLALGSSLGACAHSGSSERDEDLCHSQMATLAPWPLDATVVGEDRYRQHVPTLSMATVEDLRDRLTRTHKFAQVGVGTTCSQGVMIEGRITSLMHRSRKFRLQASGRVVDCGTATVIQTFQEHVEEHEIDQIPLIFAKSFARTIQRRLECRPPANAAAPMVPTAAPMPLPQDSQSQPLPPPPPPIE
ncbi:MAG TPA: hypothetical protein VGK67_01295 [Myxococcales bacterium]|jgi:hypothetical protein